MESGKFDLLTRALSGGSRRQMLKGAIAAVVGASVPVAADARGVSVCRRISESCTRNAQCCSGYCSRRTSLPRRLRNRCGCPADTTNCNGFCKDLASDSNNCGACGAACGDGATCSDGTCLCGEGVCFIGARGNAIPRADDTCYQTNHAALCLTDSDCACTAGSTCFCAKGLSGDDAVVESWITSVCVTATSRLEDGDGCCPTEDYCEVDEDEFACVEVMGDDRDNCGACGQICQSPRVCEAGSCNCNEDWCSHYCAQDAAEWLCAELQDGTIIEACADGYTALTGKACVSDDDCDGDEPNVPTIGGGCIKHAFISHSPRSYLSQADSGFCAWFTAHGASTCV